MKGKFEVHEHTYVSGPNRPGKQFSHSHFGGNGPHTHQDTGPSVFTIDRDDWRRATGYGSARGRKKFTAEPSGPQLPAIPHNADFEVIVTGKNPPGWKGEGGGHMAMARMALAFKGTPIVIDGRDPNRTTGKARKS